MENFHNFVLGIPTLPITKKKKNGKFPKIYDLCLKNICEKVFLLVKIMIFLLYIYFLRSILCDGRGMKWRNTRENRGCLEGDWNINILGLLGAGISNENFGRIAIFSMAKNGSFATVHSGQNKRKNGKNSKSQLLGNFGNFL